MPKAKATKLSELAKSCSTKRAGRWFQQQSPAITAQLQELKEEWKRDQSQFTYSGVHRALLQIGVKISRGEVSRWLNDG